MYMYIHVHVHVYFLTKLDATCTLVNGAILGGQYCTWWSVLYLVVSIVLAAVLAAAHASCGPLGLSQASHYVQLRTNYNLEVISILSFCPRAPLFL